MRFVHNDRGAVMLAGLFMVVLLIALVYGVVGIGRVISQQQHMQDAADGAAFSAAVFQARGMNLLAFINLVMAALVAVLVALRLTQSLLVMLATALGIAAAVTGGGLGPVQALAMKEAVRLEQAFQRAKKTIMPIIEGLHTTQRAVRVVVPWVAMTDGMVEAAKHHPPADGAFALPSSVALPAEPDSFPVTCEHSTEMVTDLVLWPLQQIGIPEMFLSPIREGMGAMGKSMSSFLCGGGGSEPPTYEQEFEEWRPLPQGIAACERDVASAGCQRAQRLLASARPDSFGRCRAGQDCSYDGPYERHARQARLSCLRRGSSRPTEYVWQKREVKATFVYRGGGWVETHKSEAASRRMTTKRPPCGTGGSIDDEWSADSGTRNDPEPLALCRTSEAIPRGRAALGASRSATYFEVTRLFGCTVEVKRVQQLADAEDQLDGGGDRKSPHRVSQDVSLGDEAFQVRALAFGPQPGPGSAQIGVDMAAWGQETEAPVADFLAGAGRFSIAQAEFYFDHEGDVPRAEWLWDLRWTARLRRFRLPTNQDAQAESDRRELVAKNASADVAAFGGLNLATTASDACSEAGGSECGGLDERLSLLDSLVLH